MSKLPSQYLEGISMNTSINIKWIPPPSGFNMTAKWKRNPFSDAYPSRFLVAEIQVLKKQQVFFSARFIKKIFHHP
jgi:hypothetical protein